MSDDYEWMDYEDIEPYLLEMEDLNVSRVARGVDKSSQTDYGLLELYEITRNPDEMYDIYVNQYSNENWGKRRRNFIARTLPQYLSNPTDRRFLALIAWAYYPD